MAGDEPHQPDEQNPRDLAAEVDAVLRAQRWQWVQLTVFAIIAVQSLIVAATLRGEWWLTLIPGLVCAGRAFDLARSIRATVHRAEERLRDGRRATEPTHAEVTSNSASGKSRGRPSSPRHASVDDPVATTVPSRTSS